MSNKSDTPHSPKILAQFITLLKRELTLSFSSPLVYVVVIAWLILGGIVAFNTILDLGYLTLRPYFQIAPYLILLFSLVLSSGQLVTKRGQLDLTYILPVYGFQVILSKFLGSLFILFIALMFGYAIPVSIQLAGWAHPDFGAVFSGNLGLLLLGSSFLSLGLFVSGFSKSQTIALIVSLLIGFLLWIPNQLVPYAPDSLASILLNISFMYHLSNFSKGLFALSDFVYFVSITSFFLYLACLGRSLRKFSGFPPFEKVIILAAAFLLLIMADFAGAKWNKRFDLTDEGLFTLDNSTQTLVKHLKQDVKILFFSSTDLPASVKPYETEIKELLAQYSSISSRLAVKTVYPDADPDAKELAKTYGLTPLEVSRRSVNKSEISRIYFGISIVRGDVVEVLPEVIHSIKNRTLEYEISLRIKRITGKKRHILFTDGHKESNDPLSPKGHKGFSALISKLKEFDIGYINPDNKEIPKNTDLLVIAGPKRPFTITGIKRIRAFLMSGHPVIALIDGMKFKWKKFARGVPMMWVPNDIGFNDFLSEFGLKVNSDMVLSLKAPVINVGKGQRRTYAAIPMINVNRKMGIFPYTLSSISITPEKSKKFGRIVKKIDSDPTSWRHENVFEENFDWPRTNLTGPFVVGTYLSDTSKKNGFRLFVFGDSDFIRDRFILNSNTHIIFVRHIFNLLLGDTSLGKLRLKGRGLEWLKIKKGSSKLVVEILAISTPAVLFLIFGIVFNLYRRRKRKRIGTKK